MQKRRRTVVSYAVEERLRARGVPCCKGVLAGVVKDDESVLALRERWVHGGVRLSMNMWRL